MILALKFLSIIDNVSNHACPGDMKIYFPFPKSYFKMFLFALAINVHISITIMQLCIAFNAIQEWAIAPVNLDM